MAVKNDFSQGSIMKSVLSMAVPTVVAQCVQLLYNMVDRIYLGRLPGVGSLALTGVGLTFPIIMLITAFTSAFMIGGKAYGKRIAIARSETIVLYVGRFMALFEQKKRRPKKKKA